MARKPNCDFHIHTKYLKCGNLTMEVAAIVETSRGLGVRSLGITDHLNSLDKLPLHEPIKSDIQALNPDIDVCFGVELNFTGMDAGFPYSEEVRDRLGFQFAIGGIHSAYLDQYDVKKLVDIQHRHHLKTCRDPLIDVLVHPYWFGKGEFDKKQWPWFDSMLCVPESYARELGQTARETGTAIEINGCANLKNPDYSERYVQEYIAFLSVIAAEGATFSVGSDAHNIGQLRTVLSAWDVAAKLKLAPDRIWRPKCKPLVGPGAA